MARASVLVVGSTGNVGVFVVKSLLRAGHPVRVLARDPKKAATLLGPRVEVVAGDLREPKSLRSALAGITTASLVTSPTPELGEEEGNFIEAAKTSGLRRLVKLSGFGIEFAKDRIHHGHAQSERRLRESGIPSVVLRPVIFMSNMLFEVPSIKAGKLPSIFDDSRVSFVDPRDVGELMARALVEPKHEGQIWEFGGPEALSYDDLAATFTHVLGRRIEHVRVGTGEFEASARQAGLPDFVIEAIVGAAADARAGKFVPNDEVVVQVLGRRASSFRDWVERHRVAFTSDGQ
jgi:uncharacterized protein YbjT (DUF2867 family)